MLANLSYPPVFNLYRVLIASGVADKNGEVFSVTKDVRAASVVGAYAGRDENVQVNGYVFILDMAGIGPKHMAVWTMADMRKWNECWQASL